MKLYATTTSERASKGQGGNDFLEIKLTIDEGNIVVGYVYLNVNEDMKDGCDENEWIVQFTRSRDEDPDIITQGHYVPKGKEKGKKKKGECSHDWDNYGKCCNCGKFNY